MVYDVTDSESFLRVKKWVKELRKIGGDNVQICIAGNKCDLRDKRSVAEADAQAYAQQVNAEHYNTSAKAGKGIDEAFMALTKRMVDERAKRPKTSMRMTPSVSVNESPTVNVNQPPPPKKKSGCC